MEGTDKAGKKRKVEHGSDIEEDGDGEEEGGSKSKCGRIAGLDVDQRQTIFVRIVPFDAGVKEQGATCMSAALVHTTHARLLTQERTDVHTRTQTRGYTLSSGHGQSGTSFDDDWTHRGLWRCL